MPTLEAEPENSTDPNAHLIEVCRICSAGIFGNGSIRIARGIHGVMICKSCAKEHGKKCPFCESDKPRDEYGEYPAVCKIFGIRAHTCVNCGGRPLSSRLDKEFLKRKPEKGNRLCGVCLRERTDCPKCGMIKDRGGNYLNNPNANRGRFSNYCGSCSPIPSTSLWFKGKQPIGGMPYILSRSGRPFAVELELVNKKWVGDYQQRVVPEWMEKYCPTAWEPGSDGSLRAPKDPNNNQNTSAIEFRSPALWGDAGLRKLFQDVSKLRGAGWFANQSCGFHVHVDASGLDKVDLDAIKRFCFRYQDDMYKLVDKTRDGNQFCQRIVRGINRSDRYCWLNYEALKRHGTIEFRLHHGSSNPLRVVMWVRLMLRMIEVGRQLGVRRNFGSDDVLAALRIDKREKLYWQETRKRREIKRAFTYTEYPPIKKPKEVW